MDLMTESQRFHCAAAAACCSHDAYNSAGFNCIMSWDLAREAARDIGIDIVPFRQICCRPQNVAAALLRMLDDLQKCHKHWNMYAPFFQHV